MANSLILAGFGMAALGMSGRIAAQSAPRAISNIENLIKSMPLQNWSKAWANSKYYRGGFQLKMTKREVTSVQFQFTLSDKHTKFDKIFFIVSTNQLIYLSKRQNHEEDFFKLCVLLKKSKL